MHIEIAEAPPERVDADLLVFPVRGAGELPEIARELDRIVGGRLTRLVEDGEVTGSSGSIALLHTHGELGANRVASVGVGDGAEIDADTLRTAAAKVAARAADFRARTVAWIIEENAFPVGAAEQARAVVEGIAIGPHEAGRWKTNGERKAQLERLVLCGAGAADVQNVVGRASVVAQWVNRCRDLVNAPPNELTPVRLAEYAEDMAARFPELHFDVLAADDIAAAGMGAFAAVARGSHNEPRLITLTYEPADPAPGDLLVGLVGKAITFDAGGLSLKPADRMHDMKGDMSGGAAVLAGLGAIAELRIPLRVVAVVAACENVPGGHAYRPSDIVTALNGKTIEVTNTDAEGRLVLADALWHARRLGATHLLDLATLTGGITTAMGDFYAGLFGNDPRWIAEVREAAEASGDHAWPLPLHRTYRRYLSSPFADLRNSSNLKEATPILGALFLQDFAGEGPWAHLDIAGTAFLERSRDDYYGCLGGTGYGVRLVAELAERLSSLSAKSS